jgi:hypothetical protein
MLSRMGRANQIAHVSDVGSIGIYASRRNALRAQRRRAMPKELRLSHNPKYVHYAESVEVITSNDGDMWVNIDGVTVLYVERARNIHVKSEADHGHTKAAS